jgi:hypothetical protein
MKELCIHHHLGLGDHFVCNGLVHEISKKYSKIHLPAKKHNFDTVDCLYKDWDNIFVFEVTDEYKDVAAHCLKNNIPVLKVGFDYLNICADFGNVCFYKQLGLDFSIRYTNFKLPNEIANADILYDKLAPPTEEYCLVHQQSSVENFQINIQSDLPIIEIKPGFTNNLLDYVKIIKNATEIHCIDSSVINLVDGMALETDKLFFHEIKTCPWKISDKWNKIKYR